MLCNGTCFKLLKNTKKAIQGTKEIYGYALALNKINLLITYAIHISYLTGTSI